MVFLMISQRDQIRFKRSTYRTFKLMEYIYHQTFARSSSIDCTICSRGIQQGRHRLTFEMDPPLLQTESPKKAPPRDARLKKLLVAKMESDRLKPQRITIRNLSAFGLSCRAVHPPQLGETVTITLGHFGDVAGLVRWVKGRHFGIRLSSEIDTISIDLAKTGFCANDYPLPPDEKFDNLMVFEFFREGNFDKL